MINILVVDTAEEYGSLIKGVLLSRHLGVSVSSELSEAREKLSTGLFDMLCLDVDMPKADSFIDTVKEFIPHSPIIGLSDKGSDRVFRVIPKPLSLTTLIRCVEEAINHLEQTQYQATHRPLVLPVELSTEKETLRCRLAELSLTGALIEPTATEDEPAKQFSSFFKRQMDKITTSILSKELPANPPLTKITARLIYTDCTPDLQVKRAGLKFPQLNQESKRVIEELLAKVA